MSFDDREKAFERKFGRDEEYAFKLRSRRRRLLALWAAGQLGLGGKAAEDYAEALAALGLHRGGDAEELAHIERDLVAKGIKIDAARLRLEDEHCERQAKAELERKP